MDYNEFKNQLIIYMEKYNIPYNESDEISLEEDTKRLYEYMKYILEVNENINLTAIRNEQDFIKKHIIDSLYILKYVDRYLGKSEIEADYKNDYKENSFKNLKDKNKKDNKDKFKEKEKTNFKYLDIGTGGGFPLIPIYIFKKYDSYGLDSILKKLKVIREKEEITILHARAEQLAHDKNYREKFDLVTSRAVSSLKNVIEYSSGFVKVSGIAILMRGKKEEIDREILKTLKQNNFKLLLHEGYNIFDEERSVLVLEKIGKLDSNLPNKSTKHYKNNSKK